MKNAHIITSSSYETEPKDSKDGVIRLKIDKPSHWDWQLTTSADTIPIIQLLDKDGRLLVETVGGTAQRAKGSFREGLKIHEEFPDSLKENKTKAAANRNFEGYSSKFDSGHFGKPRKSRSDVDVRSGGRKLRKRNSSTEVTCRSEGTSRKYSPGDYLRQQILDDFRSNNTEGKTAGEVTESRCEKVRVYLRNKSDSFVSRESRVRTRSAPRRREDDFESENRRRSLQCEESFDVSGIRDVVNSRRCVSSNRRQVSNSRREVSNSRRDTSNRERDTSNRGRDTSYRERDTSNGRRDSSNRKTDTSSRRRDTSNGLTNITNEERVTSNRDKDTSNGEKDTSNKGMDTFNRERDTSNRERDTSNRGRDTSNRERNTSNRERDTSNRGRDTSNRGRDTSNRERDTSNRERNTSNRERDTSNRERDTSNIDRITDISLFQEDSSNLPLRTDLPKSEDILNSVCKVPFPEGTVNSFKTGKQLTKRDLEKIRGFLQDRISAKMNEEKISRSRSQPIGTSSFHEIDKELEKRYSDYSPNRKNYHIRKVGSDASVVRFSERRHPSRHNSEDAYDLRRKFRSRTQADALLEADELENICRERKPVLKQKVYSRKTRSDTLLGNLDSKNQFEDSLERVWREYKDRKKIDGKLDKLDQLDTSDVEEEDFMKRPRWKDLQYKNCSVRNCRICENLKNCVDPLEISCHENTDLSSIRVLNNYRNCGQCQSSGQDPMSNFAEENSSRPKTALQENYLVLERATSPQQDSIISETTTNSREEEISSSSWNSPDFGYNSIPKQSRDYKEILCSSSTVKKSDTFKVVDGSENVVALEKSRNLPVENGTSERSDEVFDELSEDIGKREKENYNKQTNQEIAEDYFVRVYELLKRRKEEVKRLSQFCNGSERELEEIKNLKLKRRRKKRDSPQDEGKDTPIFTGDETRFSKGSRDDLVNGDNFPSGFHESKQHHQLQEARVGNRKRRPPPPLPTFSNVSDKINEKSSEEPSERSESRHDIDGQGLPEGGLNPDEMGSNLSRHSAGKGLASRRTQSSGNLCDAKGKLNSVGKIFVPCSSASRESRYKFCGSLPNHLDDKEGLEIESGENNNVIHSAVGGNLPGTLPHQKKLSGLQLSDSDPPFGTFDLVRRPSQDSLEGDPWRYRLSDEFEPGKCQLHSLLASKNSKGSDTVDAKQPTTKKRFSFSRSKEKVCNRHDNDTNKGSSSFKETRRDSSGNRKESDEGGSSRRRRFSAKNSTEVEPVNLVHKPNCQLVKHRLQSALSLDLTLSKLSGNEPQDQGYASERSPEDEQPPSLPGQDDIFPDVTPENTFRVVLEKNNRGLGLSVSGGGTAGPVRVKRLFPQQPAALSHKLEQGDILLAANGIPLTGLTNYEALEVLRTTSNKVELVVCRLPSESTGTSPDIPLPPPPPPVRREPPPPLRILNPLPPLQIEPCGEFDIEMMKVGGSLGFTLRKADSSALGHYIRALVREPALSDGRIRPGDKIVAVDGAPLSPMSHEEAVALLRQCGPKVKLRLYRDLAQTPVSALSPTEPDHPLRPPRTSLRQEAVDMLCDLAVRKLSPGTNNGSNDSNRSTSGSCTSPRKLRRPAPRTPSTEADNGTGKRKMSSQTSTQSQGETSESDQCSIKTQITNSQANTPSTDIIDPPSLYDADSYDSSKASRPSFLDLSAPQDKPNFQFTIKSESKSNHSTHGENSTNLGNSNTLSCDELDGNLPTEPASMPPVPTNNDATFSHKNPAYQSANPSSGSKDITKSKVTHSSDQDIPGKVFGNDDPGGSKGLLKWKGVMFAPDDEEGENIKNGDGQESLPSTCEEVDEVFMVELTRGWNSRLGFSLQPEGNQTVISVVHPDSVAAKDGRLKEGDVLIMINDESVEEMTTADIIDLLRKVRGSIGITILRKKKQRLKT